MGFLIKNYLIRMVFFCYGCCSCLLMACFSSIDKTGCQAMQLSYQRNVKFYGGVVYQTSKPVTGYVHLGNTINFL
jgi:hypothetical protein